METNDGNRNRKCIEVKIIFGNIVLNPSEICSVKKMIGKSGREYSEWWSKGSNSIIKKDFCKMSDY